jgi:hypothetical protein
LGARRCIDKDAPPKFGSEGPWMAAEREIGEDHNAHKRDYSSFVGMMKWGTIISFIIAMLVVLIIS